MIYLVMVVVMVVVMVGLVVVQLRRKDIEIDRLHRKVIDIVVRVNEEREERKRLNEEGEGWVVKNMGVKEDVVKEDLAPPQLRVSGHGGDELIEDKKNAKAKVLIPMNLGEGEKQILRDFYDM